MRVPVSASRSLSFTSLIKRRCAWGEGTLGLVNMAADRYDHGEWRAATKRFVLTAKGRIVNKSRRVALIAGTAMTAVILTGCSAADSGSTAESSPAPSASVSSAPVGAVTGQAAVDTVRAAIAAFENEKATSGGVSFTLADAAGTNTSTFELSADGVSRRSSEYDSGEKDEYFWDKTTEWSLIEYLEDDMKKLAEEINPKAVWYQAPISTQGSPFSPERIVETFLAYATTVSCSEPGDQQTCEVAAAGIGHLPGLGAFTTPTENVKVVFTLDKNKLFTELSIFPGVEGLERNVTGIKFGAPDVTAPAADITVTLEDISKQVVINSLDEESAAGTATDAATPNTSPDIALAPITESTATPTTE